MKNRKIYATKIEQFDEADLYNNDICVKLPDELMKQLGWEIGDEVEWEETEICEDWGEHKGFILGNLSKRNREATEAWKNATSTDME